jgi:hypothetical protein
MNPDDYDIRFFAPVFEDLEEAEFCVAGEEFFVRHVADTWVVGQEESGRSPVPAALLLDALHRALAGLDRRSLPGEPKAFNPEPLVRDAQSSVLTLMGARLAGVTYRYLPGLDTEEYEGREPGVDGDIAAVMLDLGDRGGYALTWSMDRFQQALALLPAESYRAVADAEFDAAADGPWRTLLGQQIESCAVAWHVAEEGCPEAVWALRLNFSGASVVIALGELRDQPSYMPDELVVIFDPDVARTYLSSYPPASA